MLSWGRGLGFGVEDWRVSVSELLSLGPVGRGMGGLRSWEGSRGRLGPGRWSFLEGGGGGGVGVGGKWRFGFGFFGMWGTANVTRKTCWRFHPN